MNQDQRNRPWLYASSTLSDDQMRHLGIPEDRWLSYVLLAVYLLSPIIILLGW